MLSLGLKDINLRYLLFMSHKRKTRKEKEKTSLRKATPNIEGAIASTPTYTLPKSSLVLKSPTKESIYTESAGSRVYLMHDIRNIIAAGGIVIAFDFVLYLLLSRGLLRLPFFGY